MISKRNGLAAFLAAGGVLIAVATSFSIASAADDSAASAAPTAQSEGHWHHHGRGEWRIYHQLGLTSEQKTAIKAIFTAAKPQLSTLRQQAQANHLKLLQTNPGESNYSAVVAEVAQSNATLASQRTTESAELQTKIFDTVLTAPQKAQLATLQAEWAAKITARESAAAQ